jgi:deazaflavin-dependent oxidoreductase (nitroreductase family)
MNDFNQQIIEKFRANAGVIEGFSDIVLLTTTGARSGLSRVNPVACQVGEDGTIYVFASKAGAPSSPDWFHNLVANPRLRVERLAETFDAEAEVVPEPLRTEIYDRQAAALPVFAEYQSKTDRVIPVVALRRV